MKKYKEIAITKTVYEFYCDKCGELIGESQECDDGWYEELGEYLYRVEVNGKTYNKRATLCEKCREETDKEISSTITTVLKELGFKNDNRGII